MYRVWVELNIGPMCYVCQDETHLMQTLGWFEDLDLKVTHVEEIEFPGDESPTIP